jgi:integrase
VEGRRLYHYGRTRDEVRQWLKRALQDRDQGALTARRSPTLGVWLGEWLTAVRGSLKPKTWATYEQVLRLYILPDLGRVRLRDLAPEDLERVYDALRARGLSPTTAHHAHAVLHRALRQATRRGLVVRNVAELVSAPAMARREMRTLSVEELGRLLTAAEDDPLRALWVVAVTTGMRLGEVLALRWVDVDLDRGVITVRASLQRVGGVPRMDTPKTHRSRRPVALTALVREALARHRVEQAAHRARAANLWEERGLVFANSVGRPLEPSNLRRRFFLPLLERAGLRGAFPRPPPHRGHPPDGLSEPQGGLRAARPLGRGHHPPGVLSRRRSDAPGGGRQPGRGARGGAR